MDTNFIKEHWRLTNVDLPKVLKKSGERIVYEVTSNEGKYVFKVADPSKGAKAVTKDTQILQCFNDVAYPAPRLLLTSKGESYVQENGKFVYAISFIDGDEPELTVENYMLLGQTAANLHSLRGYTITTNFTAQNEIPRMLARAEKYNMDPLYEKLVSGLPDFENLPKCLIHTDIGAHNSIKQSSGNIILVDWDDAGIGTRILDIGFPLICDFISSKDYAFDAERAKGFYESYCSMIDLTNTEKQLLFDAALFYALSYTIFDETGIVNGQWKKVLSAIEHKTEILAVIPS